MRAPKKDKIDPGLMALAMIEQRRQQDPLTYFIPSETQKAYLTRTCRYSILNGPTRGGKTAGNAVDLAQVAMRKHATKSVNCVNGIYLVFATSREAIRDNWYGKLRVASKLLGPASEHPLIPDHMLLQPLSRGERFSGGGGDRTIKEIVLRHPDDPHKPGHRIIFNVSGDAHVWKRMEGKDRVLGVYFDEAAGTTELITECFRRLLESNSHPGIKAEAGGGFLSWSATETKINEAFISIFDKCLDPKFEEYQLFKIGANENLAIDKDERAKMAQNMSADDYKVSMLNQGRAYDKYAIYGQQWNDIRHVRASDYEIQPEDNLWACYDPGYDHNTGLCVAAINQRSPYKLRFVKFWCHPKTTISQDIDHLRRWLRGRAIEAFCYDPACHKTEKGSGKQLVTIIREELARASIPCYRGLRMPYNAHEPGIYAVRRYLDPVPGNPNAESLIELNPSVASGCQRARQQLVMYRSHEEGRYTGPHGVVKKDDEFCFVAGTEIATDRGQVAIDCLDMADLIWTRSGLRPITALSSVSHQPIWEVGLANGAILRGTPTHPIYTMARGFIRLDELSPVDEALTWDGTASKVLSVTDTGSADTVYNLSVAQSPEFFANGILVHNCDLVRYLVQATGRGPWNNGEAPSVVSPCWVKRPPNLPKWEDGGEAVTPLRVDPLTFSEEERIAAERRRRSTLSAALRGRGVRRREAMQVIRQAKGGEHDEGYDPFVS